MPRLEEGQLLLPARKFKKRRAWIVPEAEIIASETNISESNEPLSITRVEHDYNMSVTRVEHECNKSVTNGGHGKTRQKAVKSEEQESQKVDCNKSITRVEHDCNMSVTRLEHECNKSVTTLDKNIFFEFLLKKRVNLDVFDFDDPCYSIVSLGDAQKKVFWHIAFECISKNTPRTSAIEIKGFFSVLDISTGVVRTTLNRLVEKRLIQRERGKLGKNGFAIIALPKTIFDAVQVIFKDFSDGEKNV